MFALPALVVSQTWHPRLDADPAHRFVRSVIASLAKDLARRPGMRV